LASGAVRSAIEAARGVMDEQQRFHPLAVAEESIDQPPRRPRDLRGDLDDRLAKSVELHGQRAAGVRLTDRVLLIAAVIGVERDLAIGTDRPLLIRDVTEVRRLVEEPLLAGSHRDLFPHRRHAVGALTLAGLIVELGDPFALQPFGFVAFLLDERLLVIFAATAASRFPGRRLATAERPPGRFF